MKDDLRTGTTPVVEGHVLHLREGLDVAIYTRNDVCWVAEFQHGRAALIDGTIWFRFHSGPLRQSHGNRAAALDSSSQLTPKVLAQIERLHLRAEQAATGPTRAAAIFHAVRRWLGRGATGGRALASRRAQDLG